MGNIGFPEMVVLFVLAMLIFGPKRLPELGKSLGKGISEFRRASSDLRNSIEREIESAEIPKNPIKEVVDDVKQVASSTANSLTGGSDSHKA
jgi:sec-independent protein translocase protein TatA